MHSLESQEHLQLRCGSSLIFVVDHFKNKRCKLSNNFSSARYSEAVLTPRLILCIGSACFIQKTFSKYMRSPVEIAHDILQLATFATNLRLE